MKATENQIKRYKKKLQSIYERLKASNTHHEVIYRGGAVEVRLYTYTEKHCIHNDDGHIVSINIVPSFNMADVVFLASPSLVHGDEQRYIVNKNNCVVNTYFGVHGPKLDRTVVLKQSFMFEITQIS